MIQCIYGTFRLPNTKTETDTDTDNLTQNPMRIRIDVCDCALWTPQHSSIQDILISLCIGLGVRCWEHTAMAHLHCQRWIRVRTQTQIPVLYRNRE